MHILLRERRVKLSIKLDALTILLQELLTNLDDKGHDDRAQQPSKDQLTSRYEELNEAEMEFSRVERRVYDQEFILARSEEEFYHCAFRKYGIAEDSLSTHITSIYTKSTTQIHVEESTQTMESPSLGSIDPYEYVFGYEVPFGRSPGQRNNSWDNTDDPSLISPPVPPNLAHLDPVYAFEEDHSARRRESDQWDLDTLFLGKSSANQRPVSTGSQQGQSKSIIERSRRSDNAVSLILSHLLTNFRSPLDRLNRWLLYQLRSSKDSIKRLEKYMHDQFSESQNPPPKDLSKWVLDCWLKDDNFPRTSSTDRSCSIDIQSYNTDQDTDLLANPATRSSNLNMAGKMGYPNQTSESAAESCFQFGEDESQMIPTKITIFQNDLVPKSNPKEFFVIGRVFQIEGPKLERSLSKTSMPAPWPLLQSSVRQKSELDLKLVVISSDPDLDYSVCCPILRMDANFPIETVLMLRKFSDVSITSQFSTSDGDESRVLPADRLPKIHVELSDHHNIFEGSAKYLPSMRIDVMHHWPVREVGTIYKKDVRNLLLLAEIAKDLGLAPLNGDNETAYAHRETHSLSAKSSNLEEEETISFCSSLNTRSASRISDTYSMTASSTHSLQIPGYWRRSDWCEFFCPGRVFAMIWQTSSTACSHRGNSHKNMINPEHLDIRRMVVRRLVTNYCWCHPIIGCGSGDSRFHSNGSGKAIRAKPLSAEDNWDDMEESVTIELDIEIKDANQTWAIDYGRMYQIDCVSAKVTNLGKVAEICLPRFERDR
ncbi:MAG: hypothetical protein Q9160_003729 [Pyrenula sp. 1 TL-2023]